MTDRDKKKDLLRKYALGLEQIWQRLIEQGPEAGNPLDVFDTAVELMEKSLAKILS